MKFELCQDTGNHFCCRGHGKNIKDIKICCRCNGYTWQECLGVSSNINILADKIHREYEKEKEMDKWIKQDHDESLEERPNFLDEMIKDEKSLA